MAHGFFTMTLYFDLKTTIIGVLECHRAPPVINVCLDLVILHLAHGSITMIECVTCINVTNMTDLWAQVNFFMVFDIALFLGQTFFVPWHSFRVRSKTSDCFVSNIPHIENKRGYSGVHSWPQYHVDLWPSVQIYRHLNICFVFGSDLFCPLT